MYNSRELFAGSTRESQDVRLFLSVKALFGRHREREYTASRDARVEIVREQVER